MLALVYWDRGCARYWLYLEFVFTGVLAVSYSVQLVYVLGTMGRNATAVEIQLNGAAAHLLDLQESHGWLLARQLILALMCAGKI